MTFTVMITTRNRREDLHRTLLHLEKLEPPPNEVLVCADGCTDDTTQMVNTGHGSVTLLANKIGMGSIPSRDRMLRMAGGEWVLSLDDDSYPLAKDFFARAAEIVAAHPEASVFTFPEQRDGGDYASPAKTPNTPGHYVSAYPNCAALMNRADYLRVGGYPTFFYHSYEEPDYALQLFEHGRAVWFEPSLPIRHHFSSANRNHLRVHLQHARNELWSVWMRCPWPWLPVISLFRIARQFQYACSQGLRVALNEPRWWLAAIKGLPQCLQNRRAIPWSRYLEWLRLARKSVSEAATLNS